MWVSVYKELNSEKKCVSAQQIINVINTSLKHKIHHTQN